VGFLVIFARIVALGFVAWFLIDAFSVEQRESKGEGKRSR
jgi:uncharacterized membrane protein